VLIDRVALSYGTQRIEESFHPKKVTHVVTNRTTSAMSHEPEMAPVASPYTPVVVRFSCPTNSRTLALILRSGVRSSLRRALDEPR